MKGIFENSTGFTKLCLLLLIVLGGGCVAIAVSSAYLLLSGSHGNEVESLRMTLIIQDLFLFILTPIVAQYFLWKAPIGKTLKLSVPKLSILFFGVIATTAISPFIDLLGTWNANLQLPDSMNAIQQWIVEAEKQAELLTKKMLETATWGGFLTNIFIIAILAGIGEELLFRGVLQKIFIDWTKNIHVGILIAAFVFSAIHFQFLGFFPRFILGAFLGYLYIWSGSIWVPIIAHCFNNALVIIFTPNTFNQNCELIQFVSKVDNSSWFVLASIIVTSLCMWKIYSVRKS
ncbi:MAG: CPBP family intramembrane glutamic endopeptidase [Bacteroidaceae bacterium]